MEASQSLPESSDSEVEAQSTASEQEQIDACAPMEVVPETSSENVPRIVTSHVEERPMSTGDIGKATCPEYKVPEIDIKLSPLIQDEHYKECYRRIFRVHYSLRLRQERNAQERYIREPGQPEGYYERFENRDEISLKGWLKYVLPREAAYLTTLVTEEQEQRPPSPDDERTYSLSEGIISEDSVQYWKLGAALGTQLLERRRRGLTAEGEYAEIEAEIKAELDPEGFLQREYFMEDFCDVMVNLRTEIAKCYGLKPPYSYVKPSTSSSYEIDEEDTSKGIPFIRRDSGATDTDSDIVPDSLNDTLGCIRSQSFSFGTSSSGSALVSRSSATPPPRSQDS